MIFRFASKPLPLLPLLSISQEYLLWSFVRVCVNERWWNSPQKAARYILFKDKIVAQNRKKSREKTKSHEEAKTPREKQDAKVVPTTTARRAHWPQWSWFPNPLHFVCHFCTADLALDHPSWAYWASFPNFLDLVWPSVCTCLLTLGSLGINLQPKTRTNRNQA